MNEKMKSLLFQLYSKDIFSKALDLKVQFSKKLRIIINTNKEFSTVKALVKAVKDRKKKLLFANSLIFLKNVDFFCVGNMYYNNEWD